MTSIKTNFISRSSHKIAFYVYTLKFQLKPKYNTFNTTLLILTPLLAFLYTVPLIHSFKMDFITKKTFDRKYDYIHFFIFPN
jgi:hypothetical protein